MSASQKPIRVLFFCLGNICRSPLGEALFRYKVQQRGLEEYFEIDSAGTNAYRPGSPPHPGSQRVAKERLGLDISNQKSVTLTPDHLRHFDYLIAMDRQNLVNGRALGEGNFKLMREYETDGSAKHLDVPDPWGYGGEQFEYVYELIDDCCTNLLDEIVREHGLE